jgi:glycosyltransferase involved in cell wall biosynthesis
VVWKVLQYHHYKPYTLLHAHAFLPAIPGKVLRLILRKPLIYTVHGSPLLEAFPGSFNARIEKWLLTQIKYDQVITVGQRFLSHLNVNQNIKFIPNGVDTRFFKARKQPKTKRATFEILWVGRFDPIKGVDVLLHAFAKAVSQNDHLRLSLVGYGYALGQYKKLTEVLGITKYVRFLGKKEPRDLVSIYQSAHVFVLPSLAEGQPLTVLEAWACEIPVIVTNVGDNNRLVKPGINGWLIKPENIKELSATFLLASRSKKLALMGRNGRLLIESNYTWDKSTKAIEKIYLSFLKEKNFVI